MDVLVTGGAGFIGARLCRKLLREGSLQTPAGLREISRITVLDYVPADLPDDPRLNSVIGSAHKVEDLRSALTHETQVVFHLAAVVSLAAERDFDLGYNINLKGTTTLLELCRELPRAPQFVMASSAAVYGGPLPPSVGENTALFPQTSYGTQKAISELLVSDYTRKGFVAGCCLRLPTIVVRPGKPNLAASSFASSLVREPLMGRHYVCPVPSETPLCLLSVRRVVNAFLHAASLSHAQLGHSVAVQLPGLTMSAQDLVRALGDVAGPECVQRISFEPEADIVNIVNGWPARFEATKALRLGFQADQSPQEIITGFVEDEMGGKLGG